MPYPTPTKGWDLVVYNLLLCLFLIYLFVGILSTFHTSIIAPSYFVLLYLVITVGVAILVWSSAPRLSLILTRATAWIDTLSPRQTTLSVIAFGVLARSLWTYFCTPSFGDEYVDYLVLAGQIIQSEPYGVPAGRAYLLPGQPLLLAPFLLLLGESTWVPLVANLILYVITILATWSLTSAILDQKRAKIAVLVVALWPNFVLLANYPENEYMLAALFPLALLLIYRSGEGVGPGSLIKLFLSGCIFGWLTLTQPPYLLCIIAILLAEGVFRTSIKHALLRFCTVFIGMALLISPWTIRNYFVFDEIVLLSTNSGPILLKANNPGATGKAAQTPESTIKPFLEQFAQDEVLRSKMAKQEALDWIRQNPGKFAALAIKKQVYFLAEDDWGVYRSRRHFEGAEPRYSNYWLRALDLLSNTYWILVLGMSAVFVTKLLRSRHTNTDPARSRTILVFVLTFFALLSTYSVFESRGEYHVGLVPIFALLSAGACGKWAHQTSVYEHQPLRSEEVELRN